MSKTNNNPFMGSISGATLRSEDLISAFTDALEHLDRLNGRDHSGLIKEARAVSPDSEDADYIIESLFDALDEFSPAGYYFGAHPGDSADFGFWPAEDEDETADTWEGETERELERDGYVLRMKMTGREIDGKTEVMYEFISPEGNELFAGSDFYPSPLTSPMSDAAAGALLGFLTLRPGDTDREYFEHYSPTQLAFAEGPAEQLQTWGAELEEGESKPGRRRADVPRFANRLAY